MDSLISNLENEKFFKFINNKNFKLTNYNLIINCDKNNYISKKFFL